VNGDVIVVKHVPWASYAVSVVNYLSASTCTVTSNGAESVHQMCAWNTTDPITTISFPDDVKAVLPSSGTTYVIYKHYDNTFCFENSNTTTAGQILDNCAIDDQGEYMNFHFDGKYFLYILQYILHITYYILHINYYIQYVVCKCTYF
jgi:hypothetical protein